MNLRDRLKLNRQKLKSAKPVIRTVKRWTNKAERDWLHWLECFWSWYQWSGWAHRFCNIIYQFLWEYVHSRTHLTYNNDKPWFTAKLRRLRQAKEEAYRNGTESCINRPNKHWQRRSEWQRENYSEKLRKQIPANDPASVWKGLKDITNYKTPPPSTVENPQLADDLLYFF